MMMSLFLFLSACSDDRQQVDSSDDHNGEDTTSGFDTASLELNGTWPESPIDAPEFTALNYDNTSRGQDDLIGNPSVLWFYPAAGTFG